MSLDPLSLVISFLVGSTGFVAFMYGKRRGRAPQLCAGIALMVFPYFIPSPAVTLLVAALLVGLMVLATKMGW